MRKLFIILGSLLIIPGCSQNTDLSKGISQAHNLEITVSFIKNGSQDFRDIVPNIPIDEAELSCSEWPITDEETHKIVNTLLPSSPTSWCHTKALNLPLKTDTQGKAILFFNVQPSPEEAKIQPTEGPEYNVPMLYLKSGNVDGASGVEAVSANKWQVQFPQPINKATSSSR